MLTYRHVTCLGGDQLGPIAHVGPIPINWYGLTFVLTFLVGGFVVRLWAPRFHIARESIESLMA